MDNCPVVIKIQPLYLDKGELENKLTIQFKGDIYRNVGDLKSRKIVDNEKENLYYFFSETPRKHQGRFIEQSYMM